MGFLRQLSVTADNYGCDRAGSLMQLRPSNEGVVWCGVVFLCIRSLLPALIESESVALTGVQSREQQGRLGWAISPTLLSSPLLSVAATRGEF